jgi:hypothetical protein
METKKIVAFVVVLIAASTRDIPLDHQYNQNHVEGPAPGPNSSDAVSFGSILGATLFSFIAYYLHIHA